MILSGSGKIGITRSLIGVLMFLVGTHSGMASAQQAKTLFTVADEIGLTHFGDPYTGRAEAVLFSPDGNYLAVDSERGRLDLNRPEDSLRFYRVRDIEDFLKHAYSQPPSPVWVVTLSTDPEGPVITKWRWLADSSGVAFLERVEGGNQRLVLADIRNITTEPLTPANEMIREFDIRDREHYVYIVADPAPREQSQAERDAPAIAGSERPLYELLYRLLFPDDARTVRVLSPRNYLWAVVDGKRFEAKNNGSPIVLYGFFGMPMMLSPDGRSLVTTLPVPEVPSSWETLYPPPYASSPYRIRPGRLDVQSGDDSANQYVRIDLQTGSVQALTDAPISDAAGWWAGGTASWSSDGKEVLLPGTFIKSKDHMPSRPCVAVVDLPSNEPSCVEMLKGHTETGVEGGYHRIDEARFLGGNRNRVAVIFTSHDDQSIGTTEYRNLAHGKWQVTGQFKDKPKTEQGDLEVTVKQGLNEPPLLVATNKQTSRAIWDPNPQLKNLNLGQASVYKWKDKEGREWKGGLYKPVKYKPGRRYPLVIQTHGFSESEFIPSGVFPTAFAARALAATGIMVLQTATGVSGANCPIVTPEEGPCEVAMLESAANQLVSDGSVDRERIGIIGFSRTCFYVMDTLTTGSLKLRAASVTDGVMETYLQYMMYGPDVETKSIIGAMPFGEGLQQWLKRSPGFNLDRITTPLLVVGGGRFGLLHMWEPYAGLRYLQKPVDLMMLNTDEHVLTNPAVRMASQGGSVDWFRFWLQDYEDPDPAKAEQYARWRKLRQLQDGTAKSK
jgi:dipeptidyl aminopeptidase/acylaminoacyl peptidase